jgi:4-amino-4-deoxy-L-arabinose transferase-like glycosyltransferase
MTSTLPVRDPELAAARDSGRDLPPPRPSRLKRLWRGRPDDTPWVRPALLTLLAGTAVLYLWGLGASGYANSYYAAAVQAGTQSWKAWFFGSLDASNFITVDKPPGALWVMGLSGRLFGFSSWSMLVPQALAGVATVALMYATVRRWFGPVPGLLTGAIMALTPVAVLMFRFNNPDALLVLLLVAAAYALTRALEEAGTRWLLLAGTLVGFAFLTKMLQAFLVLPAFALVYLVAAPTPLRRRIWQTLAGGAALVAAAGWYVAVVELWPADSRPYIGGSTDNSFLNLVFGYNGLSRLSGGSGPGGGAAGRPGGGDGFGGSTGLGRMFNDTIGTQISWLLPAALIALVAGVWLTRRAPRTNRARAAMLLWGGWLLVTAGVFSYMSGTFHEYYTVALAPPIAALVGIVVPELWRTRRDKRSRGLLAAMTAVTGIWAYALLNRTPDWTPWLRYLVLIATAVGVAALLLGPALARRGLARRGAVVAAVAGLGVLFAGPAAFAVDTAATPHAGSIVLAGPRAAGTALGGRPAGAAPGAQSGTGGQLATPGGSGGLGGVFPAVPGMPESAGSSSGGGFPAPPGMSGMPGMPGSGSGPGGSGSAPNGAGGTLGSGSAMPGNQAANAEVAALIAADGGYTWAAATVSANAAAPLELATGRPVMAIGGFSGSDPAPTLAQFQQYVREGKVHYFVVGGGGPIGAGGAGLRGSTAAGSAQGETEGRAGGPGGVDSTASQISAWVAANFTARTVGGVTVYDLTQPSA